MPLELAWMRAEAPYMPIAVVGLLALLDESGCEGKAHWGAINQEPCLRIDAAPDGAEVAALLLEAPWPDLNSIPWPGGKFSQGLKPTLKGNPDPFALFRDLASRSGPTERTLLEAILTDGVLDGDKVPSRSRLLRGVKADLSSISHPPKRLTAEQISRELVDGPHFRPGESGLGLGLVPEVQTFGGTTGPEASTVGAYSALLYLLLWRGLMALPPVPVMRGPQRVVGGPLVSGPDTLSWPRWRSPATLRSLRSMLSLAEIHADSPDRGQLIPRGIDAVYRARAVPLNSMVAVYRWGKAVMGQ